MAVTAHSCSQEAQTETSVQRRGHRPGDLKKSYTRGSEPCNGEHTPVRLVCLCDTVSYLSAGTVPILQALLNNIGGKLVLAESHHLPLQLLNDVLPASHGSA